ncbi:hypothetical protein M0R04_11770 [Candidatus Dojkabacteria bacterium]|jgi:hypothetical protein|nr:hypothetical protein [Candidatus Dojkabacteria bacterium]
MFIGKATFKENSRVEKIEVKLDNIHKLLELISTFSDLDLIEVHIYKEVI